MTWIQQIFGQSVPTSHVTSIFLGGYILGCLTTGYYLVRFRLGLDIRTMESGSVGARNVGRVLGMPGFVITLLGDFAKGLLAAGMTRYFTHDDRLTGLAMLAVVMGHIWPLQLGLRGGKGVATSLGVCFSAAGGCFHGCGAVEINRDVHPRGDDSDCALEESAGGILGACHAPPRSTQNRPVNQVTPWNVHH